MFLENYGFSKRFEKNEFKLDASIKYWCNMLLEKIVRIFVWDGLPANMPQREIETRLILNGFCGMVKDGVKGIMVANGGMSGTTQYADIFTKFTYSAPTAQGGTKTIGKDCVIINNSALRNPLYPLVYRYAFLLSHADISLKCALVNARYTDLFSTDDQQTAESVRAVRNKIYDGDYDCIVDSSIIGALQNMANTDNTSNTLKQIMEIRTDLLRGFYNDIGIKYVKDKKERMISDEVSDDNQMLLFNINDMLHQREKACDEINTVFGLQVSVKLSDEFNIIKNDEGVTDNVADELCKKCF